MDAAIERAAVHERMQRRITLVEVAQRLGDLGHSQLQRELLAIARSITDRDGFMEFTPFPEINYCPERQQETDDDDSE